MSSTHGASALSLAARLADLLGRERAAMADFLLALAAFERERRWLELGYPNLFMFLHHELGLSRGAAHYRKTAADLVRRFPEVIEPLRDGRLCITSVVELARVATPENLSGVLPRFFHRSRREAKEIAVEILPAAVVPRREVIAIERTPGASGPAAVPAGDGADAAPTAGIASPAVQPVELEMTHPVRAPMAPAATFVSGARREAVEPLTAELGRLHVTVSRRFLEKLERARAALSHAHPGAGAEQILEAGLDLVIAAQERRQGATDKPLAKPRPAKPGHVPASVKREVWKRDEGRCQWPMPGRPGGICGSTHRIEYDHREPRAFGGPSTADGVRLLCKPHNLLAARLVFGNRWMDRYTRRKERSREKGSGSTGRHAPGSPAG